MYEVSNELVEIREEAQLLRLQMEVAQQEEEAAKGALAAAQAALAAALAAPDESVPPEAHQVHEPPGSAQNTSPCKTSSQAQPSVTKRDITHVEVHHNSTLSLVNTSITAQAGVVALHVVADTAILTTRPMRKRTR